MKQGSTDDPFADDPMDTADERTDETAAESESTTTETSTTVKTSTTNESEGTGASEPATDDTKSPSLPYIYRRDTVKDDRSQTAIYLRDTVEDDIDGFLEAVEDDLGEDISKLDAMEAAIVIAQENPGLVADKLREWGYDWE